MATSKSNNRNNGGKFICLGLWMWLLPLLVLMMQQQTCECRYLPTRSHGDDLDKLRELMLQILESSNEEQQQQQQLRPPNEANGNTLAQQAAWLKKLSPVEQSKYNGRNVYDSGRYY